MDLSLIEGVSSEVLAQFARYADAHELYPLVQDLLRKVVVAKPADPLLWMANELERKPVPSIVILAPPTMDENGLAKSLANATNAVHISATALLRTAVERKTSLGMQALPAMSKNALVPDRVMLELVLMRLEQPDAVDRGWVLDGFPRTRDQAVGLQRRGILPSNVIILDLPDPALVARAAHIHTDPVTNTEYDLHDADRAAALAPEIRARLVHKGALSEAAVTDRLAVYRRHLPGILAAFPAHARIAVSGGSAVSRGTKDAVARALQVRRPIPSMGSTGFLRLLVCGGDAATRDAVCRQLEDRTFFFVYVSPHRIFTEEISRRGPNAERFHQVLKGEVNLTDAELLALLESRTSAKDCAERGWVLSSPREWTAAQVAGIAKTLHPSRVLILPNTAPDVRAAVEAAFQHPVHPYFVPASGAAALATPPPTQCLQDVEMLAPGEDGGAGEAPAAGEASDPARVAERVRQLLLRPIEYKVPRLE
ncbi:hypothetical protein H9P43_000707 [Blastocladiella emersonii ATCC 22665]|nr:hypothetical protein H9P43_000707 [Blastocladiella emersonii ATCC 22665]